MNAISEKSLKVLNFLKTNTEDLTLNALSDLMGVESKSMNGTLVALGKKGYVVREEAGTELVDGKAKVIKYIRITEDGMAYDHDAAIAADIAAKTAPKAE